MAGVDWEADSGLAQVRLFQMISAGLPIGAFAYSQGLESAVERGWVGNADTASQWIAGVLTHSVASLDVPVIGRMYQAWQVTDAPRLYRWNAFLIACRDTAELRAEERHLGEALARLLSSLEVPQAASWWGGGAQAGNTSYAAMFTLAATRWNIPLLPAVRGYVWTWLENQVAAAVKLVPLGQSQGQRMLASLASSIPEVVERGLSLDDDEIDATVPGLFMASALHESQYTRLFRS